MESENRPAKPTIHANVANGGNFTLVITPLAEQVGLVESLVLMKISYFIEISDHFIEGKWWAYKSLKEFKEDALPYLGTMTISRALKSLEENGYINIGNFNKRKSDRTQWFSINPQRLNSIHGILLPSQPISQNETTISQNGTTLPIEDSNISTPIVNGRSKKDSAKAKKSTTGKPAPKKKFVQRFIAKPVTDSSMELDTEFEPKTDHSRLFEHIADKWFKAPRRKDGGYWEEKEEHFVSANATLIGILISKSIKPLFGYFVTPDDEKLQSFEDFYIRQNGNRCKFPQKSQVLADWFEQWQAHERRFDPHYDPYADLIPKTEKGKSNETK